MSDLSVVVQQAQTELSGVCSVVNATNPDVSHPSWLNIKAVWFAKAKLHEDLGETMKLFESRDAAMQCLENLRSNILTLGSEPLSSKIQFGATQIPMFAARLLAVDSYLAVTWSIYDRLTNVLGRLMGASDIVNNSNPAQNPKLVESLITQAKGCYQGFGINELLLKLYGESIYASYFLRNSFIHDGGMMGNIPILSGNSAASCFELSKESAERMNRNVAQRMGCSSSSSFRDGNVIDQIKLCHDDLDKMFASLVKFVVGSFCAQVSSFGGKIGIAPAANATLGERG